MSLKVVTHTKCLNINVRVNSFYIYIYIDVWFLRCVNLQNANKMHNNYGNSNNMS